MLYTVREMPAAAGGGDLQYGGKTLDAAAVFWARWAPRPEGGIRARPGVRGAFAFARLVFGLPRLEVRLSEAEAGRRIRAHLGARVLGLLPKHRLAQGVLAVPPTIGEYFTGRSRRAARTNVARAVRAGIVIEHLVTVDARRDGLNRNAGPAPALVDRDWRDFWSRRAGEEGRVWLAASDPHGRLRGLAVATVDVEWAMLEVAVARDHCVRWLLQTAILEHLVDSGVQYIFTETGNALSVGPALRHVQRLLGYSVTNLSIGRAPPSRRCAPAATVADRQVSRS